MPARRSSRKVGRRRKMRGGSILGFLGKANSFLRNSKLVSTIANGLGAVGVPYAGRVGNIAGRLGYGRKSHGYGLSLAGGRRRR